MEAGSLRRPAAGSSGADNSVAGLRGDAGVRRGLHGELDMPPRDAGSAVAPRGAGKGSRGDEGGYYCGWKAGPCSSGSVGIDERRLTERCRWLCSSARAWRARHQQRQSSGPGGALDDSALRMLGMPGKRMLADGCAYAEHAKHLADDRNDHKEGTATLAYHA